MARALDSLLVWAAVCSLGLPLPVASVPTSSASSIQVVVQDNFALAQVGSSYVGVSVDPVSILKGLTFAEPLLIKLASNLGPGQVLIEMHPAWGLGLPQVEGTPASLICFDFLTRYTPCPRSCASAAVHQMPCGTRPGRRAP